MNALAALTLNGFREARRNRVTTVVYVFALVIVLFSTVALDMTVATFDRVMIDLGLGSMSLIAAFLSIFLASGLIPKEIERRTIFMVLAKPLSRSKFIVGRFLGNLFTVYAIIFVMTVLLLLQLLAEKVVLHSSLWASFVGIALQSLVVSAIAFAFAAASSQFITSVASVSLYFLGHLTPDLYSAAERSQALPIKLIGKFLYYILPNLDRLNFSSRATYRDPVEWSELLSSTTYAVAYAAVMLFIAAAVFERRDFK
jgi:Cu-processing system permease protein